jgi:polysaccharide biosynthesis transport protein
MQTWDLLLRCLHLLRRWWLLVLIAGLTSGATSISLLRTRPLQYVTRSTLMVGNNLLAQRPQENANGVSMTLAAFYAEMARRTPITGRVVEQLKLPFSADVLNEELVSTRVIPQAQLIEITVLDTNPERAAQIANGIAQELIRFSPTAPDKIEEQQRFTQAQLQDLQANIENTERRMQELNAELQKMTSAGEIAEAQQRLRDLTTLKTNDQATYNGLLQSMNESALNSLSVFEAAEPPTRPLPQRTFPSIVLSVLLGLVIGVAAAWILDDMDDTWRRNRRPELIVREPALAYMPTEWTGLLTDAALHLPRGQQCLALRAELLMRLAPAAHMTLMVTSARASLERSRLSSDLARLFARSGQQVLLIDANLGENFLASAFGTSGDAVQTLLREPGRSLSELVFWTDQPDLALLPGNLGDQSAHLVPTLHWPQAVQTVQAAAEMAIFDGPPVLDSADATLLGPHMGGVLLVIDPATERCSETRRALARLHEVGAPVLGVVLLTYQPRSWVQILRRLFTRRSAAEPRPATQ